MPKALADYLGYTIYFWVGDITEPVHVHISKGNPAQNATKVWIKAAGVELAHNHSGIPDKDLKELLTFINENKNQIIVRWTLAFNSAQLKM